MTSTTILETIETEFEKIIIQKIVIQKKQDDDNTDDNIPFVEP